MKTIGVRFPKKVLEQTHWLCADGRKMLPEEMSTLHKINVIRLMTRRVIKACIVAGAPRPTYSDAAAFVCAEIPMMVLMAKQVLAAGMDPFKDYGGVLVDENAYSDYPLSDVFEFPNENATRH